MFYEAPKANHTQMGQLHRNTASFKMTTYSKVLFNLSILLLVGGLSLGGLSWALARPETLHGIARQYQRKLKEGMTEVEVVRALGEPKRKCSASEVPGLGRNVSKAYYYDLPLGDAFDCNYFIVVFDRNAEYYYSTVFEN
jgi:hypothetical protein